MNQVQFQNPLGVLGFFSGGFFFPSIVVWGFLSSSEKLEREIFSDDFGINKLLNDKSTIS